MKLLLKRAIARSMGAWVKPDDQRSVVLLYHSLGESPWASPTTSFQSQMAYLTETWEWATLEAISSSLRSAAGSSQRQVAITFDDGYGSVFDLAAPILKDFGAVGTVFVCSSLMRRQARARSCVASGHYPNEDFMTQSELRQLSENGWEIGSHGVAHDDLCTMNVKTVTTTLRDSRHQIEDMVGAPCVRLAYPWGRANSRVIQAAVEAGFTEGYSGIHAGRSKTDKPFLLPRINIGKSVVDSDFQGMMAGHWDFMSLLQKRRLARLV